MTNKIFCLVKFFAGQPNLQLTEALAVFITQQVNFDNFQLMSLMECCWANVHRFQPFNILIR